MSASRQKKLRKEAPEQPVVQQETGKSTPKIVKWIIGIVLTLAALALITVSLVFNSSYFHKNSTAATVGEHSITPAEMNYFYKDAYYSMSQTYGDMSEYLSYMTDSILETAVNNAQTTYAMYDAAVAEGYVLTEDEIAELDAEIEDVVETAQSMQTDANTLLAASYGKGCDKASYRAYRELVTLVARYTQDKMDAVDTSVEAVNAYYTEHADDFDTVTYRQFFISVNDSRTKEEAKALADKAAADAKVNEAAMDEAALEYADEETLEAYPEENPTLLQNISKASASAEAAEWLFAADRKAGDTTVIEKEDGSGCMVLRFSSRNTGDYNTVNVRHILISAAADADEQTMNAAKEKAESCLQQFRNGDKTEESFAELAKEFSEDNAEDGGLYENVTKGQMVEPFENWIFDTSRKTGDTDIVQTDYGYHVMYFVGEGESARQQQVTVALQNEAYDELTAEVTEGFEVKKNDFGLRFVTTEIASQA